MATNHLLKCGTTLLLSSYHRTLTAAAAPTTVKFLPLSLFPAARRSLRRHCTVSDASVAAKAPPTPPVAPEPPSKEAVREAAGLLDIRVGKVVKAWRHPDADTLYVEEVDIGENEPRTICSGLVKFVPIDLLQDKKVVVLANLKPRNMRGVKSSGMLMAASDAAHENVELLVPPEDSVPGERIWFGPDDEKENQPEAASANQIQKKKVWELVQPHLKTDASRVAMLDGNYMMTSAGPVVSTSLTNANIS